MSKAKTTKPKPKFNVGDRGFILWGGDYRVPFVVTEDRGCIGLGGRRLIRVRMHLDYDEPRFLELPEAEIEPDVPAATAT